ncbi:glycosyltransferase, partial [Staphylococcus xylosus]|nr:glycosyltransferase [Staphylococcus xylosus]
FSKLLNYGIDGLISFNNKPLRAMIYLGLMVFFISLLYIGYISVGIMIRGVETPGYFSTIAAILLLGGIQLISIGIVGEYIGRIYYEVKQRPKYIVQASNFKCADEANYKNITQDINDDVGNSERRKSSKTQDKKKKELIKNR